MRTAEGCSGIPFACEHVVAYVHAVTQEFAPDRAILTAGMMLGRYRLVGRIGEGGMGEVWKAHDANLDREVAIKMLLRGALQDATTRERFRREALVLSRLSHTGVATVFDFDARDGCDFLVMEYVAGGTLETRIAAGTIPIDRNH